MVSVGQLELECTDCDGRGYTYGEPELVPAKGIFKSYRRFPQIQCSCCHGKGKFLTDLGEEVLDFIRFWLKE